MAVHTEVDVFFFNTVGYTFAEHGFHALLGVAFPTLLRDYLTGSHYFFLLLPQFAAPFLRHCTSAPLA